MRRTFVFVAFPILSILLLCCTASAQVSDSTLAVVRAANDLADAGQEGWADAVDLLERELNSRETAPADRYVLAGTAGSIAKTRGEYDRALANYEIAKASLKQIGGEQERIARITEIEADLLVRMDRADEAGKMFEAEMARSLADDGSPSPAAATIAASLLADAMNSGDEQRVAAEIGRAGELVADKTDLGARATLAVMPALAAAFKWFGYYELMHQMIDIAVVRFGELSGPLILGTAPEGYERDRICQLLDTSMRTFAGMLILTGDVSRAGDLLTITALPDACAEHVPASARLYRTSLEALVALAGNEPHVAERQLTRVVASIESINDDDQYKQIIRSRVARTQAQLGFLGKAASYFDGPFGDTPIEGIAAEIDRLLGTAEFRDLSGELDEALAVLETADALATNAIGRDWYTLAQIAYRRIFLLIERDRLEEADLVRKTFEDRFEFLETEKIFPDDRAQLRSRAFRNLSSLRLVADLLKAVAEADRSEAGELLARAQPASLPADPGVTHHVQRAKLKACLLVKGAGGCEHDISDAFSNPRIASFDWVHTANEVDLAGDRYRLNPSRNRIFEPIMAALWNASQSAIETDRASPYASAFSTRYSGQMAGGYTAFLIAQEMFEGGAETAISQIGRRLTAGDARLAELLRERQEISEKIARGMDAILGGEASKSFDGESQRLEAINRELRETHSSASTGFRSDPLHLFQLEELLASDEAMLVIVSSDAATYVFAATAETLDWVRVPLGTKDLESNVVRLRRSLDQTTAARSAESAYGDVEIGAAFDRKLAYELFASIIAPLKELTREKMLYVAVEGPLASLPLSVLVTEPPLGDDHDPDALRATHWFIRDNAYVVLPSPAALRLKALRSASPVNSTRFVGFGDPVFETGKLETPQSGKAGNLARSAALGQLRRLPGTRGEVEALAGLFGKDGEVRLGGAATETAVKETDFADARVVAFATHGLLAGELGDNDEAGLAFSVPRQPDAADDGFLSASEAATLSLDADWLLLSACNTAASDGRPDSSSLSGLARAFLFAGARSILVSHWPVRDDAAAALTTYAISWHMRHPERSKGEALRRSILHLLDDTTNPDMAHPSAWGPFVVVGDSH